MSEFLKNLRSNQGRYTGKKHNPYESHYFPSGQDRRTGSERRSSVPSRSAESDAITKKLGEILPSVRNLLDKFDVNQDIFVELNTRRAVADEGATAAFKLIAESLQTLARTGITGQAAPEEAKPGKMSVAQLTDDKLKSPADERRGVIKIMKKLRRKGSTYKEIAIFLNERGIPTFSNKGKWHAQTIHRLCSSS